MHERVRIGHIVNNSHTGHRRGNLLKQFQPFGTVRGFNITGPGDVTARPRPTSDKPKANRITCLCEYDRHAARFFVQCRHHEGRSGKNHLRFQCQQLGCVDVGSLGVARRSTVVDLDIATFDPAQLFQALPERHDAEPPFWVAFV